MHHALLPDDIYHRLLWLLDPNTLRSLCVIYRNEVDKYRLYLHTALQNLSNIEITRYSEDDVTDMTFTCFGNQSTLMTHTDGTSFVGCHRSPLRREDVWRSDVLSRFRTLVSNPLENRWLYALCLKDYLCQYATTLPKPYTIEELYCLLLVNMIATGQAEKEELNITPRHIAATNQHTLEMQVHSMSAMVKLEVRSAVNRWLLS